MEISGKVAFVTAAGSGIGEAISRSLAGEGARVAVADLDSDAAHRVAHEIEGKALTVDVADQAALIAALDATSELLGPIDILVNNAGVAIGGGGEVPDSDWDRAWQINFMSQVTATRHILPTMIARGGGYLVHTASAAGLLTNLGAAPYAVTKHAVVALAEWLSITHAHQGIRVSCLCPQFVSTNMLTEFLDFPGGRQLVGDSAITPAEVGRAVVEGIEEESFLILPHPEVAEYFRRKGDDYERWLGGMRKLQAFMDSAAD
ncbi:MAG: SDR family oxidoreductase [Acidimicrobiia bacterium]|nr:SDR family oxidoreductase [Acidimicrobiia bacterium]